MSGCFVVLLKRAMRQSTDPCLLCHANPATKTNSHILPHFISTGFLGPKTKRRGFELSSRAFNPKKSKIIQDSPKEHYILCPACEHYLGVLEGLAADTFLHWRDKVDSGEFEEHPFVEDLTIVFCNTTNAPALRLLVYSMFWRASISSHPVFQGYTLSPTLEGSLGATLLSMKSSTTGELLAKLSLHQVALHPYACLTARTFPDETTNVVAGLQAGNQPSLNVDKFGFLLYGPGSNIADIYFSEGANTLLADRKLMVFSEPAWHNIMVEHPAALFAKSRLSKGAKPNQ